MFVIFVQYLSPFLMLEELSLDKDQELTPNTREQKSLHLHILCWLACKCKLNQPDESFSALT